VYNHFQKGSVKMSVVRVHKTGNYTVMSNHHFKEKKMSLKAKGLLSLMLSLPDDWNYSIAGLVKLSKDGKDGVMSALAELEKFGYLYRVKLHNEKGHFSGIEYNIYEHPQEDFPSAEIPISDKPISAKRNSEDPPQLNTNELNTKNNKILYNINNYIHILDTIPDEFLRNLYCYFLDNRNMMGAPLTVKGLELLIERVREIAGLDIDKQKALLRTAVINNWKNVYPRGEEPAASAAEELKKFYEY
jgi:hypothetical protein